VPRAAAGITKDACGTTRTAEADAPVVAPSFRFWPGRVVVPLPSPPALAGRLEVAAGAVATAAPAAGIGATTGLGSATVSPTAPLAAVDPAAGEVTGALVTADAPEAAAAAVTTGAVAAVTARVGAMSEKQAVASEELNGRGREV
jgi:hypothetical protein